MSEDERGCLTHKYQIHKIQSMVKRRFRDVRDEVRNMVRKWKLNQRDFRRFPEIRFNSAGARRGRVHMTWKPRNRRRIISPSKVWFESINELGVIVESIGRAWTGVSVARARRHS
jgi:hypothetical protein